MQLQPPPDLRRLSVNSLLSTPHNETVDSPFDEFKRPMQRSRRSHSDLSTTYGYDLGKPDLDVPNNDDANAIRVMSPATARGIANFDADYFDQVETDEPESRARDIAFEVGGYYAKPVPIRIPKILEPLPPQLLESPMNLLYFHHFLNHTARILVPHDCEQNPFRQILPQSKSCDSPPQLSAY